MTSSPTTRRATGWGVAFPLVALLAFGMPGCGDDDSSAPDADEAAPTDQEQDCDDWAQLQSAAIALGDVQVVADGTDALRGAVGAVDDALEQLGDGASEQAGDEVEALRSAVSDLADELSAAVDDPAGEGAGSGLVAVGESVQRVAAAADDLGDELRPGCEA